MVGNERARLHAYPLAYSSQKLYHLQPTCNLIYATKEKTKKQGVMCTRYGIACLNKRVGFIRQYCWNVRTREWGDEQDGFGSFPSSNRTEKVPPGGRWSIPLQAKPAHNDILCTNSKGNQAKQDKPAGRSPCRRSAMLCPWCCFWRSALTEHGAETIAYT